MKQKEESNGIEKQIIISRVKRERKPRWWLIALIGFLLGALGGLAVYFSDQLGSSSAANPFLLLRPPFRGQAQVNILLIGSDNIGKGLADTLIVAQVDTKRKRIGLISIPRDSRVNIPGHGTNKINSAHALGEVPLTEETVSLLLGIPINYYLCINSKGLEQFINAAGGVEVDVKKRMRYHDSWGKLDIDLQPGLQRLNGEQAVGFVRFRHDAVGDIGRMQRQQEFLRALAEQVSSPSVISRLPSLTQAMLNAVDTNLSARDLIFLAEMARRVDPKSVPMATLPAMPQMIHGISYLELDPEGVKRTVADVLYGSPCDVELVDASGNGTGRAAAKILQDSGFQVTALTEAPKQEATRIIDHHLRPEKAEQLCHLLSCNDISRGRETGSSQDFTVEIGSNFRVPEKLQ